MAVTANPSEWPIKKKKRGSRERSPPPCQIKTLILPRCPEAHGNIDLDLTLTRKFCRTLAPRGATLSDHICAPSNGIQAAVYDSIGPAIGVHDRQYRYPLAPRTLKPSAQSRGGAPPWGINGWPSAAILRSAFKW